MKLKKVLHLNKSMLRYSQLNDFKCGRYYSRECFGGNRLATTAPSTLFLIFKKYGCI